ncbi:extracellular solute-binding protein, family 1 [Beutenbergia cavernae DSM 12333]|uniref:Extracellular solute-binding protein, family 1 n=1 Tax=Beutenbergia cavernae (strain ATCC BAA-8 / DSM 12333 / CCUG 43141 / JCM 11478 / NBRC 16432 / NCIMB 13614 / HKI 0122) TaxID=471853 RepID=C5BUV0_BEUC1|nr:extracellular solute-binding protein [Beutenbergia cavernae]ACQ78324.1 extracellular solute-binding protein, family 1 [Beutenbergia cavernae DSM 12333]
MSRTTTARRRPGRTRAATGAAAGLAAASLVLTACTGGGGGEGDGGGEADGDSGGGETIQILVLKHPLTGPMADMGWVADLEEAADVTIEWEEVSADWDQKKSTMLAAGDIPDLIVGTNAITNSDFATFQGLFEDLSDDLDALPNVQGMFEALPETEIMATQPDGTIYGLPGYRRFWPQTATRQYVNQEWLDNLGLETPTTLDELFDVLVAFKDEDANGNGDPNDEIPMDWSPTGTGGFGFFQPTAFLGSFGLPISGGGGAGYFVEDGEVGNFLTDERYRDVVEFLHECYAAGLISEEVMTQDYSAYQSVGRGDGDTARVGFSWGWTSSDRFGAQLAPQYAATGPMVVEGVDPVWSFDSYGLNYGINQVTMSASTDVKDAALRVIDAFYDQDMSLQVLWGEFGQNIEQIDDSTYEVLPPADGTSDPSTWKWTTTLADNGPSWIRDDIDVTAPADLLESAEQEEPLGEALDNIDIENNVWPGELIKMDQADLSTVSLNNTNVLNIAMQKWAEWITGGGATDQWDDYVAQLEGSGLTQNIEIHQRYYDEYVENR